jgi:hypothetical protein
VLRGLFYRDEFGEAWDRKRSGALEFGITNIHQCVEHQLDIISLEAVARRFAGRARLGHFFYDQHPLTIIDSAFLIIMAGAMSKSGPHVSVEQPLGILYRLPG